VAETLARFGHQVPTRPAKSAEPAEPVDRVNRRAAPARGRKRPGWGFSATPDARLRMYRADNANAGGLYPLLATPGTPPMGALLGTDLQSGGGFYCHPIGWVKREEMSEVTNPNLWFFGEPGRGKTSGIVAICLRLMPFGVKTLIAGDLKGEYTALCNALGVEVPRPGGGSAERLNPLDLGRLGDRDTGLTGDEMTAERNNAVARWTEILKALATYAGHPPDPTDEQVLQKILRVKTGIAAGADVLCPVTIPGVHAELRRADPGLVGLMRFAGRQQFLDHLRGLTDALGKLIDGDLAGLFDGETTYELDWDAPILSVDLSRLWLRGDAAIGIALACIGSWARAAVSRRKPGDARIIVRDELWRQIGLGAGMVDAINAELRLSRDQQLISLFASHKPDDLLAVGDAGSQAVQTAGSLLALCNTFVLLGQKKYVTGHLAEQIGLSDWEQDLITGWGMNGRGNTLWKLGSTGYQISMYKTPIEEQLVDTNKQLSPDEDDIDRVARAGVAAASGVDLASGERVPARPAPAAAGPSGVGG
jgi:hypothetical protein